MSTANSDAVGETIQPENIESGCAWSSQDAINADNALSGNIHLFLFHVFLILVYSHRMLSEL